MQVCFLIHSTSNLNIWFHLALFVQEYLLKKTQPHHRDRVQLYDVFEGTLLNMHSLHHTHQIAVLDHRWLCEEKAFVKDRFGANSNSTLLNLFFLRSLGEN